MNKLFELSNMGFKISWKLISVGLFGYDEIPVLLNKEEIFEYLNHLLTDIDEQTDDIIALICEKDDCTRFDRFIKEFANKDYSNIDVQKRKWRAYLLKNLIGNINRDYVQGLLELMEFWSSTLNSNDCPLIFPQNNDKESARNYFTQESYELSLNRNKEWLKQEILNIIKLES